MPKEHISIHAPLVGSDALTNVVFGVIFYFNPRSPCGERRLLLRGFTKEDAFQSTLPLWGATVQGGYQLRQFDDFNPRSPCGERPDIRLYIYSFYTFQSTLPLWGATSLAPPVFAGGVISIHAPLVGSDPPAEAGQADTGAFQSTLPLWGATSAWLRPAWRILNFNPRSPCGERLSRVTSAV